MASVALDFTPPDLLVEVALPIILLGYVYSAFLPELNIFDSVALLATYLSISALVVLGGKVLSAHSLR
jgi:hypothetical protein